MPETKIGLVGAGQMAQALASGWVQAGCVPGRQLVIYDPAAASIAAFKKSIPGCGVGGFYPGGQTSSDADRPR